MLTSIVMTFVVLGANLGEAEPPRELYCKPVSPELDLVVVRGAAIPSTAFGELLPERTKAHLREVYDVRVELHPKDGSPSLVVGSFLSGERADGKELEVHVLGSALEERRLVIVMAQGSELWAHKWELMSPGAHHSITVLQIFAVPTGL